MTGHVLGFKCVTLLSTTLEYMHYYFPEQTGLDILITSTKATKPDTRFEYDVTSS